MEALEWLENKDMKSKCTFAKDYFDTIEEISNLVEELYEAGSPLVEIGLDIEGEDGEEYRADNNDGEFGDTLVVHLPEDMSDRFAVMSVLFGSNPGAISSSHTESKDDCWNIDEPVVMLFATWWDEEDEKI